MWVTRRAAALAAIVLSAGCAAVTTAGGQRLALASPEFAEYVEQVFRRQNRVATELAFAIEDAAAAGRGAPAAWLAAEDELLAACAGLNELATARRDARRVGLRQRAAAARTASRCETAVIEAEAALARASG
jgi:hypothetical protein